MQSITIRHLEPADIPQVHALYSEPQAYSDTLQIPFQPVAAWEKRLDGSRPGIVCLVAIQDDQVVGQLGLEVFQSPRRRHVATFGMGVKSSARGAGVGTALVAAAIETCEKWMNVSRIEVEVYTDNQAAISLYQKHGFMVEGTCRNYAIRDGRYVSAHLMARVMT
ncbi:MAG: GNAT family N-acetyltransferase [Halomonas sp.]|nr:GNAT family N-acetyltransferase [Halomonas sp.]MCC5881852.1 GNAT family N-acetyltransferase [Halomonas sp.]